MADGRINTYWGNLQLTVLGDDEIQPRFFFRSQEVKVPIVFVSPLYPQSLTLVSFGSIE